MIRCGQADSTWSMYGLGPDNKITVFPVADKWVPRRAVILHERDDACCLSHWGCLFLRIYGPRRSGVSPEPIVRSRELMRRTL